MSEMQLRLREEYDRMNAHVGFFETFEDNIVSYGNLEMLCEIEMEIFG